MSRPQSVVLLNGREVTLAPESGTIAMEYELGSDPRSRYSVSREHDHNQSFLEREFDLDPDRVMHYALSFNMPLSQASMNCFASQHNLADDGYDYEDEEEELTFFQKLTTFSVMLGIFQILILLYQIYEYGLAPSTINPLYGPSPEVLNYFGAKNTASIVHRGEVWRIATPVLLHAGIIHLAVNMFIQLRVGVYLETEFGFFQYVLVYAISGVYGAMCSAITLPETLGVGASGALMGLHGAWLVVLFVRWNQVADEFKGQRNCQLFMVVLNIVVTMAFSFVSFVDWAAHGGGLIAGFAVGFVVFIGECDCLAVVWLTRLIFGTVIIIITGATYYMLLNFVDVNEKYADVCRLMKDADASYTCDVGDSNFFADNF